MPPPLFTLHLNDQHEWRGGEQQVLTLSSGLRARGHTVLLAAQPGSELGHRARTDGIEVLELPTRGEIAPAAVARLRTVIEERRPDIVHCHTSHSHMHGVLACLGKPQPKLVVSRRVDFSIHKTPLRLALVKYRTRVDRYIAISQAVRNVLMADGVPPDRIGVVLSGLDPTRADATVAADLRAEFGIGARTRIVATVAALVGHKGHRYLIDAIPAVRAAAPDVRFLLVGEGPLRAALDAQARERGVADAILFAGFRTDFLALTAACDLYVMPSHLEGLNTSVIDAMFLARPIVAAAAGGLPELIRDGETGWLAPKENPSGLAAAIVQALGHPDEAAKRGRAASRWAREHVTADKMVEGTLREYAAVLG